MTDLVSMLWNIIDIYIIRLRICFLFLAIWLVLTIFVVISPDLISKSFFAIFLLSTFLIFVNYYWQLRTDINFLLQLFNLNRNLVIIHNIELIKYLLVFESKLIIILDIGIILIVFCISLIIFELLF